jgi:tetratricopeptide (TPR) repeat protein
MTGCKMALTALAVAALTLCAAAVAQSDGLPEELQGLTGLKEQEERALQALRDFDRAQVALLEWDIQMHVEHRDAGDKGAAQTKLDDANRRRDMIRLGYEEFLKWYPNNARAHNYYGELLFDHFGDEVKGLQEWKLAASLDSKLDLVHNNLAIHYFHVGEIDLGLRHFEQAIKLDPENPDFLYNGAQFYLNFYPDIAKKYKWSTAKVFQKAIEMSRKATENKPGDYELAEDYAVNFFAAKDRGAEADWKACADAWVKARALAPHRDQVFHAWLNEARAAKNAGDNARAAACIREALTIHPDSGPAKRLLDEVEGRAEKPAGEDV